MTAPYEDIIHLSRPVSASHPKMSMAARAAQFSPFAALTGYGAVIDETARHTEARIELNEDAVEALCCTLNALSMRIDEQPRVTATYFLPDREKPGGTYRTVTGSLKRLDNDLRTLFLTDGTAIPLEDLAALEQE